MVYIDNSNMLYEIERGSYNTMLGSVELSRPVPKDGENAAFFLVGGGGYGIPYYRTLQKADIPFSVGILFENDVDFAVASSLAEKTVSAKAFEPIPSTAVEEAKQLIQSSEYVVDCGCPIGEFNSTNGILLDYAKKSGKKLSYHAMNLTRC